MLGLSVAAFLVIFENHNRPGVSAIEPELSHERYVEYYDKSNNILDTMTLDEKIGQLLFARVPENNIIDDLQNYHLGGYILFGRDVEGESIESLTQKISSWQDAAKIKLFIGIDEEGGAVSRLTRAGLANFASPQELYEQGGMELIKKDTSEKVALLKQLGINVNFAPVADTCTDPNVFIYERTFGKNATETAEYIKNITEIYNNSGVSATLKHFPGYGNNADTHTDIAIDERELGEFQANDFLPFKYGIDNGADFVMFSHNIIKTIDEKNPASISPAIHSILFKDLEFSGIMITDDLSMDAISEYYHGEYPAAVQAVIAGNNMLIVSDYKTAFNEIKQAVENGTISESLIDYLIIPNLSLKIKQGLLSDNPAA